MTDGPLALILGVTGQDGSLLAAQLIARGWRVVGGFRRGNRSKLWRLDALGITDRVELVDINLADSGRLFEVVRAIAPAHLYHFAGESFVASSFESPRSVLEANTGGTLNVLEALRLGSPETRMFFASSSEIFGTLPAAKALNENSPVSPSNPYAVSKLAAQQFLDIYRGYHGLFTVTGILFNHESEFRARNFVTRKITYNIARLALEGGEPMRLGNFGSARDWGAARDYVGFMPDLLAQDNAENYVVATGRAATVREFLALSAACAGFAPEFDGDGIHERCVDRVSGQILAEVDSRYFRRIETRCHIGDASRLRRHLPKVRFTPLEELVATMTEADIARRKKGNVHV